MLKHITPILIHIDLDTSHAVECCKKTFQPPVGCAGRHLNLGGYGNRDAHQAFLHKANAMPSKAFILTALGSPCHADLPSGEGMACSTASCDTCIHRDAASLCDVCSGPGSRLAQIVEWCGGEAFDGALVLDECHVRCCTQSLPLHSCNT